VETRGRLLVGEESHLDWSERSDQDMQIELSNVNAARARI
jgi:hypothetical protein